MPDTENSIQETGIPVLTMEVSASNEVQWPVDDTLSISGEAADAKVTGDAIADLTADLAEVPTWFYPVGAIYMTTNDTLPTELSALGTWEEIRIPLTWGDIKNGTRSYAEIGDDDETESGTVHFWLRTA